MEECDALKRRWVGVGEIPDGDRWDSPPKIRFAPDSPPEEDGFEVSVPGQRREPSATANTVQPSSSAKTPRALRVQGFDAFA
jgi:hypothetical protein